MSKFDFNPLIYQKTLKSLIKALKAIPTLTPEKYHKVLRKHQKLKGKLFSKSEVIAGIRQFNPSKKLIAKLLMKPIRTLSGVVPVTLLTKPFPCPGKCIFCPDDKKMPKSYLSAEPGAQRAALNHFDPYNQVFTRLQTYYANGHSTDKVELIILGGTWSVYPEDYQIWFVKRCFDALNNFNSQKGPSFLENKPQFSGKSTWNQLKKAQTKNETAQTRCIGLSLETRPDRITKKELINFRKFGCTKVQIGLQSLSDIILKLNQRGHTTKESKQAIKLLRLAGFKIQAHWMANLYGSNPKKDKADFQKLFKNPAYRPDELKIYPTALLKTAKLMDFYQKNLWQPYTDKQLLNLLVAILPKVPQYCRVSRMIRDFSADDIMAGSKTSNLRQLVEPKAKKIQEIRFREIRKEKVKLKDLKLKIITYKTSVGKEKFLQYVTLNNQIAGFLRLSLPSTKPFIKELESSTVIRELHVYGQALNLGASAKTQHLGLGTKLIQKAVEISQKQPCQKLSVISAIGTKEYYKKLNFKDGQLYQHLKVD